jgi:hypothetical protein
LNSTSKPASIVRSCTQFLTSFHLPHAKTEVTGTMTKAVEDLKQQIVVYQRISAKGNDKAADAEAEKLVAALRRVEEEERDPKVKEEWRERAKAFLGGGNAERAGILDDIVKGLGLLLITPVLLAGAAIFAAGAIVYGAGSLVKGLGNVMTGGLLSRDTRTRCTDNKPE